LAGCRALRRVVELNGTVSKIMWVSGCMTASERRAACPVIVPDRCRPGAVWRCHPAGFGRRAVFAHMRIGRALV